MTRSFIRLYEILEAFYNQQENEWIEVRDEFGGREIRSSEYELLYYTQDINTKDVVNLVFENKDNKEVCSINSPVDRELVFKE